MVCAAPTPTPAIGAVIIVVEIAELEVNSVQVKAFGLVYILKVFKRYALFDASELPKTKAVSKVDVIV
jgi:hypothetical protein